MPTQSNLNKFIFSLTIGEYNEVKTRIIKECNISEQVYYNWRCGRTDIPILCKEKINEIAYQITNRKVFEL